MKRKVPLQISFHNPNTNEQLVDELIKLSAEVAKAKLTNTIIHKNLDSLSYPPNNHLSVSNLLQTGT